MKNLFYLLTAAVLLTPLTVSAAYHHSDDTDSDIALQAYPTIEGTKLDSCALCHTGGEYVKNDKTVELGSCLWCHYTYGYDESGDIDETLNDYGRDYRDNGRSLGAFPLIETIDSDGDTYTNKTEITALRFPGDPNDDPSMVPAPYMVISRDEMESNLPYHEQTMLMNTHKSGDFYTNYGGVPMSDLLDYAEILDTATGITAYAPDGWSQYHPLDYVDDPLMYHVYGEYPPADFYWEEEADVDENVIYGWCDYSSPAVLGLEPYKPIDVPGGLQMILAYKRDLEYLETGILTTDNKLDGEGPFRVVPPQKVPGPPDQSSKADDQDVIWPFNEDWDHNAGFATRSTTIIKVDPLPEGTTDIDTLEAGWNYVDEGKILIYGAINPLNTILEKLAEVQTAIDAMDQSAFRSRRTGEIIQHRVDRIIKALVNEKDRAASVQLASLTRKVDGCTVSETADANDWVRDCDSQASVYWPLYEASVLHGDL